MVEQNLAVDQLAEVPLANAAAVGIWTPGGRVAEFCSGNFYRVRLRVICSHAVVCIRYFRLEGDHVEGKEQAGEGRHVGKNNGVVDGN